MTMAVHWVWPKRESLNRNLRFVNQEGLEICPTATDLSYWRFDAWQQRQDSCYRTSKPWSQAQALGESIWHQHQAQTRWTKCSSCEWSLKLALA